MGNSGADKSKGKDSKKVNSVSAQDRLGESREPEVGTGENIFDEQKRDSADVNPVSNYRIKQFALPNSDDVFSLLATDRDENGRIEHIALAISPETVIREYQYDGAGRLSKVTCGKSIVEQYAYGKYGERLTSKTSKSKPQKYAYNEKLQLIRAGEVKYLYNNKGRLFMKTDRGQVTTYYYHDSGQLNEVRLPDGRKLTYIYDPLGRRVVKKINGKTIESYLWQDLVTLVAISDDQGMNMKVFTYDEDGNPVSMSHKDKTYHFATDQVGTIFAVANGKGNTVKEIIHDSFGNLTFDSDEKFNTNLGFAAGLLDVDTGLIHFGYRDYDPAIGRFISPDPLGLDGGDVDVYGYCLDDPINFIDRTGLMAEAESEDDVPSHELSSLKNAGARSTTGQAEFAEKKVEAKSKPEVKPEGGPNNELSALKNGATRSTTGQAEFKGKPVTNSAGGPSNSTAGGENLTSFDVTPPEIALNGEGKPIMMCSQKGTMVPVSPGEQAAAIRRASERDAKRLADGDVEDTYGARVGVSLSLFGFKVGGGLGVHVIDKDNAVLVGDYEYGMSNVIGAGFEYSLEKSNAKAAEDFEGEDNSVGTALSLPIGPSGGISKSSNGKSHSTAATLGVSFKSDMLHKLKQPIETTVERSNSFVWGQFDPTSVL